MKGNKRNRPPKNHHRPAVLPSFTEFFLLFFFRRRYRVFFYRVFGGRNNGKKKRNKTKNGRARYLPINGVVIVSLESAGRPMASLGEENVNNSDGAVSLVVSRAVGRLLLRPHKKVVCHGERSAAADEDFRPISAVSVKARP